jgi:hypothetical protein
MDHTTIENTPIDNAPMKKVAGTDSASSALSSLRYSLFRADKDFRRVEPRRWLKREN